MTLIRSQAIYAWQGLFASEPQDNNNIKAEHGDGSGDIRHNFSFNFLCDIPMGKGYGFLASSPKVVSTLVSGWQVNALGIVHSGIADNIYLGTNTYGNGDYTNQRPDFVPGVAQHVHNKSWRQYYNPDAWTVPLQGTFGDSPRNGVYGPGFAQVDSSLVKQTALAEGRSLEFRAEFFNIFNHPNFAQPNSTCGQSTPGPPDCSGQAFGQITSTFGSTIGLGTSRQIEFAVKLHY